MCDSSLAIYCFIDDFLKQSGHREDVRIEVTDAEVITIAITAMLHFGGNFERSRLILHELDVPFGTGLSPLEIIAASGIIHSIESGN